MSTATAPAPTSPSSLAVNIAAVDANILQFLPLATQTVVAVEAATKGAVPGTTKATMALNILQTLINATAQAVPGNANVQAIAGLAGLITAIVSAFNTSGVFTHSAAPVTLAPSTTLSATTAVVPNANPNFLMKVFHPNVSHQQEAAAATIGQK